jgi:exosome complex exonuclease RRP6
MVGVHPYRAELGSLQYQPWQLQKQQQQQQQQAGVDVLDLESVPVTLVDTAEGLSAMVSALQGVKQVAIDLEHHSYR